MRTRKQPKRYLLLSATVAAIACLVCGCPAVVPPTDYNIGFDDGFARDDWYWAGYYDGFDTVDFLPIYYQGGTIPFIDDLSYDAGFWDGVWYAYNDGYFVDYHYAFILGFSEGYDNAFWPDYLYFLANDFHTEYLNGGWTDGYEDGFSEGRVFGANDFEQGLPFDWLDALLDYESGTDLFFEEVGVGTGVFGPVILYEYGTDPFTLKTAKANRARGHRTTPSVRPGIVQKAASAKESDLYRPFIDGVSGELDLRQRTATRPIRALRLLTSWTQRLKLLTFDMSH